MYRLFKIIQGVFLALAVTVVGSSFVYAGVVAGNVEGFEGQFTELRGNDIIPGAYIDLSDNDSDDYDARLQVIADNTLRIDVNGNGVIGIVEVTGGVQALFTELRGNDTIPGAYIDLSDNDSDDYDARLQVIADNTLRIDVNRGVVDVIGNVVADDVSVEVDGHLVSIVELIRRVSAIEAALAKPGASGISSSRK